VCCVLCELLEQTMIVKREPESLLPGDMRLKDLLFGVFKTNKDARNL